MSALMLHHRETDAGPVVIEWSLDEPEPHCHASGGLIIFGTDRCEAHSDEAISCVFEWRMPPECEHPKINLDEPERPRCVLCGVYGRVNTERWLKYTTPAAAGFASYDEVVLLGDPGDDHSSLITPANS
jgi:hypothetical protein